MEGKRLLHRWDKFVQNLSSDDHIAVIYDADSDGVAAAVIIAKMVQRVRGRGVDLALCREGDDYTVTPLMIDKLKKKGITKIITVDLALDEDRRCIKTLNKFAELVIIDHHPVYPQFKGVWSKRILLLKPQLLFGHPDPAKYASAKLCYDLAARAVPVTDLDWLAAIGIIGDCATSLWKDFLHELFDRYALSEKEDWFNTSLGKISALMASVEAYNTKCISQCFCMLYNATSFTDLVVSPLSRYTKPVDREIDLYLKNAPQLGIVSADFLFLEITPKYRIKSALSTLLGQKMKNKTVVVADVSGQIISVSTRRNDYTIPMNTIIEKAIEGLENARGGGHIPAAAARMDKKDYPLFKKRFLRLIEHSPSVFT